MYQKWEYKVVQIERNDLEKTLSDLGGQGWELTEANRPTYSAKHLCIFKRPLEEGNNHADQAERQGS